MKQSTQKFLARLLVLLLVLGLVPSTGAPIAYAATTDGNSVYYWGEDASSLASNTLYLSRYSTSTYPSSQNVCVRNSSGTVRKDLTWSSSNTNVATVSINSEGMATVTSIGYGTCTVSAYLSSTPSTLVASFTVYVDYNNYYGNALASVTLYTNTSYLLGNSTNVTTSSVVSQLISRLPTGYTASNAYVQFLTSTTSTYGYLNANTSSSYYLYNTTTSGGYLGNVTFIPTGTGTSSFHIRLYYDTNKYLDGYIYIVTGTSTVSGGDIAYTGVVGENVYFNAADFQNFYSNRTGGTLSSVTFTLPSSSTGTLYTSTSTKVTSSGISSSNLDNVYFQPYNNYSNTVRINFTAYGTWGTGYYYNYYNYNGYGYNNAVTGTVVIDFINNTAKDITYTPTGGSVKLNSNDFTAVYRDVVGSTAPSTLTIQFQDVPSNGTLTYNSTSLRSTNIKSYRFTATQLNSITYSSSSTRTDTIEYIAYVNGTARYTGNVVFNPNTSATSLSVTLSSGSSGVAFNQASFIAANTNVMTNCVRIRFASVPTYGTVTYSGITLTAAGLDVVPSALGQVYYTPRAGYNGTDRIAFFCYDVSGNQIGTGQVNIVISGNGSTTGASAVSQFTDVPSNAWYYTALSSLVSKGLVQGVGNGKANPEGTLDYGQALKMILLAAGYPTQQEPSGNDWAINYKNLAVNNGLISSSITLTAPIPRDAVVELAAKALKIAPSTSTSPFSDSNNGYAIALYRTSPQIITGYTDGTFGGSKTLLRQEVWEIIYKMTQYVANQNSTQMPDGI